MTTLVVVIVVLASIAFGLLGFVTGRHYKPDQRYQLYIIVPVVALITATDIISGFKLNLTHILGPWLVGVLAGALVRKLS